SVWSVLNDDGHDDCRRVRWGEANEPAVRWLAWSIFGGPGFSRDVDARDLGPESEGARARDGAHQHGRKGFRGGRRDHLALGAGRDLTDDVAFGVAHLGGVVR